MKGVPRIRLAILNARTTAKRLRAEFDTDSGPVTKRVGERVLVPMVESLESLADATEEMLELLITLRRGP
jgi:hypothetical protein